jgi:hypothetical protein
MTYKAEVGTNCFGEDEPIIVHYQNKVNGGYRTAVRHVKTEIINMVMFKEMAIPVEDIDVLIDFLKKTKESL